MAQTPFTETEALLAVMNNDEDRLAALLADMTPNELNDLRDQAWRLFAAARDLRFEQRFESMKETAP